MSLDGLDCIYILKKHNHFNFQGYFSTCFVFISELPPIKKNFYIESPEVANMHPSEVEMIRYSVM